MRLDQALEEPVAELEDLLAAVERLAEAEQLHRAAERGDHPIDGGVERLRRIERERDRLTRDPAVELSVPGCRVRHALTSIFCAAGRCALDDSSGAIVEHRCKC
ncbi:MAG: hypothetical protein DIU80_015180 [Chloroflexota bacterium]